MKLVEFECRHRGESRVYDYKTWVNPLHVVRVADVDDLTEVILITNERLSVKLPVEKVLLRLTA